MATIAELLQAANRKIAHLEQIKTAMKSAINGSGSTVGDKFADYPPAVTNGRAGIAAAITERGVQTPADAPFDVLEANVRAIESGGVEEYTILVDKVESSYIELPIADIDSRGFSLFFGLRDSAPPMMENDFNIVAGGILSIRKEKSVSLSEADVFFFQARPNYNMGGVAIAMKGSDAGLVARQLSGKPILYCENVPFLGVTNGDTSYVGCYRLILE